MQQSLRKIQWTGLTTIQPHATNANATSKQSHPLKQITGCIKYKQKRMLHLTELLLNFYFHIFAQYYAYFNIRFEVQRQCSSDNAAEERLLPNPNALVPASKGMQTVKLCTNKILQLLTGGAGRLTCIMVVKWVVGWFNSSLKDGVERLIFLFGSVKETTE